MQFLRRIALMACLGMLAACATPQTDFVRVPGSPVYPPTSIVDVLEQPPSRAYVEIGTIDVPGEPGALRAQVLAQIRTKAGQIGADAVILKDVSYPGPTTSRLNPTTGQMETIGGQQVPAFRGVAIKYR